MSTTIAELESWWDTFPPQPPDRQRPQWIVRTVMLIHGKPLDKSGPVSWRMPMHRGLAQLACGVGLDVCEDQNWLILRTPMSKLGPDWRGLSNNALDGFAYAVSSTHGVVRLDNDSQRDVLEVIYDRASLGTPTVDHKGYWVIS